MIKALIKEFIFYLLCVACWLLLFAIGYLVVQFYYSLEFEFLVVAMITLIVFYCFYICVEASYDTYKNDLTSIAYGCFRITHVFGKLVSAKTVDNLIRAVIFSIKD